MFPRNGAAVEPSAGSATRRHAVMARPKSVTPFAPFCVLRQKWSRAQTETRLANLPPCLVGMEARVGAHHLMPQTATLPACKVCLAPIAAEVGMTRWARNGSHVRRFRARPCNRQGVCAAFPIKRRVSPGPLPQSLQHCDCPQQTRALHPQASCGPYHRSVRDRLGRASVLAKQCQKRQTGGHTIGGAIRPMSADDCPSCFPSSAAFIISSRQSASTVKKVRG